MFPLQYSGDWTASVPEKQTNFRPARLWGSRFNIELVLIRDTSGKEPTPRQPAPVRVSMAIGSTVSNSELAREAVEWQRSYFETKIAPGGEYLTEPSEIEKIFVAPNYPATFIYLLCHGQVKSIAGGAEDVLEFAEDFKVTPRSLITENVFERNPVVFLNSCSSAAISPLSLMSFLKAFLDKRACGTVAASCTLPTRFAAAFGQKMIDGYLEQAPIGEVLLRLRRELLNKWIPLGLFYTLQCPLDTRAPERVSL